MTPTNTNSVTVARDDDTMPDIFALPPTEPVIDLTREEEEEDDDSVIIEGETGPAPVPLRRQRSLRRHQVLSPPSPPLPDLLEVHLLGSPGASLTSSVVPRGAELLTL
jgi:hypothetical protein